MATRKAKPHYAAIGEGTRLKRGPSEELVRHLYEPLCRVGPRYFAAMSRVNLAHVVMLTEEGILPRRVGALLLRGLREVEGMGPDGFPAEPAAGDLYTSIEGFLIGKLGPEVGGCLQLGRSRGDLHAAVDRLVVREGLLEVLEKLLELRGAVLEVAGEHGNSLFPSYTFQQHAQVMSFAQYLLGCHGGWARDTSRLFGAYGRADASVLGAAIGSGTSWPLDRERTRELLGHGALAENAKDAVWDGDFILEAHAACAILIARHLRLVLDLYGWTSYESRLVDLADEDAGSSSIMPQKKNPYALVALRNKATRVLAELQGALAMACLGSYRADMLGLNLPPVTEGLRETAEILDYSARVLRRLTFNRGRGLELAAANFATVTELVDTIVRIKGLSYRSAHHVVGTAVRMVTERGEGTGAITAALLDRAARKALGRPLGLPEREVRAALDPASFVAKRTTRGGTAPREVRRMLRGGAASLRRDRGCLAALRRKVEEGERKLEEAVGAILRGEPARPQKKGRPSRGPSPARA